MEKYARQAVSEGVKNADDLHVGGDSELYRVLNLHYNRNNHIEVWGPQVRGLPPRHLPYKSLLLSSFICFFTQMSSADVTYLFFSCLLFRFASSNTACPKVYRFRKKSTDVPFFFCWRGGRFSGSFKLPLRRGADVARVLQSHPRRSRCGTIVEEVDLQDHLEAGRSGSGIFQISEFLGAIGVT